MPPIPFNIYMYVRGTIWDSLKDLGANMGVQYIGGFTNDEVMATSIHAGLKQMMEVTNRVVKECRMVFESTKQNLSKQP